MQEAYDAESVDIGHHYEWLGKFTDEKSVDGIKAVRQAAINSGHSGLLNHATLAEYGIESTSDHALGYDYRDLTPEEQDAILYGDSNAGKIITYEEKLATLKNAIGLKQDGEKETWFRGRINKEHMYRVLSGNGNGVVCELYKELFLDSVDKEFFRTLPEFADTIAKTVESAVLSSESVEDAEQRIFNTYVSVFVNIADKNLEEFKKAFDSEEYPAPIDYMYARKIVHLSDVVVMRKQVNDTYSKVLIDAVKNNVRKLTENGQPTTIDYNQASEILELSKSVGVYDRIKDAYLELGVRLDIKDNAIEEGPLIQPIKKVY